MTDLRASAACRGKTPYSQKADALAVIRHRNREGRLRTKGRGKMAVYRCSHCSSWHIGSESMRGGVA